MKPINGHRKPIFKVAVATWLHLGAAAVFADLACLSPLYPSASGLCVSTLSTFAFPDVGRMYLLMSMTCLPAWLTLIEQGLERETGEPKGF